MLIKVTCPCGHTSVRWTRTVGLLIWRRGLTPPAQAAWPSRTRGPLSRSGPPQKDQREATSMVGEDHAIP
jgi:hypothetical protein